MLARHHTATVTPHARPAARVRQVISHYITLRSRSSTDTTYYVPSDVPFLEPPGNFEFEKRFRDEELARMRDGMRDAYRALDVARSECAKAQNEVVVLKRIVSNLMPARAGAMVQPQPPAPPAPPRDSVAPSQVLPQAAGRGSSRSRSAEACSDQRKVASSASTYVSEEYRRFTVRRAGDPSVATACRV